MSTLNVRKPEANYIPFANKPIFLCLIEFITFCFLFSFFRVADILSSPVTRYIVGYKKEESDLLLKFLFDHVALSQDLQTRVKWTPGTVVVWDVSFSSQQRLNPILFSFR